jgi:PAS domain S-box-containing protein
MQSAVETILALPSSRDRTEISGLAWLLMEASQDAMILVDPSLCVVAWNPAAEAIFGWKESEIIGHEVVELVPERIRGTYRLGLPAAMAPNSEIPALTKPLETFGIRSTGEEFPIQLSFRVLGSGDESLLVASVRDTSDLQLLSTQQAAGENHARFVANMSHELRTPLNSVLGFAQLLGRDPELSERQRRYVGHIMDGGGHLLEVIDDILDLDRLDAGRAELRLRRLPVRPLLETVIERLNPAAAGAGVRVNLTVSGAPEVDSDERRLTQIITNLLSNGIKFTPDGGEVGVTAHVIDGTVEITFTDTGVGIPLGDQERIFDAFAQGDSRLSRSYAGTGLGLSLSRRLAALLGGELTVSSVVGKGSTFLLVLPLTRPV